MEEMDYRGVWLPIALSFGPLWFRRLFLHLYFFDYFFRVN
jgi:hypothetical protein